MDPTRPITYRGINLNGVVAGVDGLVGSMVQRLSYGGVRGFGYTEKKALNDGMSASDVYLGGRTIKMEAVLNALSRGDLFDRLQDIVAALTPTSAYAESPGDKGYLPLYFYVPTARLDEWPTGEIECFIRARPMAQPEYPIDRDRVGGDDNSPIALPWSVVLDAKDPRIYIVPRVDVACTTSGGHVLENRGSYSAPVNFMLIVPAAAGTVTISIVGAGADMTLSIPNDPLPRTVRISTNDEIVTSQLGSGVETVALNLLTQAANSSYPFIPAKSSANINLTTSQTLTTGSIIWYYETLA